MTTSEIIQAIKDRETNTELQDEFLLTLINHAYLQICSKIRNINRDYFLTTKTITGDGTTLIFDLPKNFRSIVKVTDDVGGKIEPKDLVDYGWSLLGGKDDSGYIQRIQFGSAPSGDYTIYYNFSPNKLDTTDNIIPLFPEDYHETLILGAMAKLHVTDDDVTMRRQINGEFQMLSASLLEDLDNRIATGEVSIEVSEEDLW